MRTILLVLSALLAGCAPCHEPEAWTVTGDTVPEGVEVAIQAAREAAPCEPAGWGGTIEFQLLPFPHGPEHTLADGSADDTACNPRIRVATFLRAVEATALDHELGHVLWVRCRLSSYDAGRGCHPRVDRPDPLQEVPRVAERLGHPAPAVFEAPAWACPE
jgi:hypothetical protein